MKRLSLIVLVALLVISCAKPKTTDQTARPTAEPVAEETAEVIKPPAKPKVMTYRDYQTEVLDQLADMSAFKSRTEMKVVASGGSFLMPGFTIEVLKTLEHSGKPLASHVTIKTSGPFFLNLGPSHFEMYTKDDKVYAYDEKSKQFKLTKEQPEKIRQRYDAETEIQKKLWQEEKLTLETKDKLVARLTLDEDEAQAMVTEILKKYGITMEFDQSDGNETIDLEMTYDKQTYRPQKMVITGRTKALGYQLDIDITVTYSNVK